MTLIAFTLLVLGLTIATFALSAGRRILAFASAGAWFIYGAYSYTQSTALWDINYGLFWFAMGMVVAMSLVPFTLREKKEEDIDMVEEDNPEDKELLADIEAGEKERERYDRLFGHRKKPARMSAFARTGIIKTRKK